jgi:hypothetical protein
MIVVHNVPRVQGVVATVPVDDASVVTILVAGQCPGVARGGGQAAGLPPGFLPPRGRRGSGVKAGRRPSPQAMRSSLEAGGAAPYAARRPQQVSGGASRLPLWAGGPGWSGRLLGQNLVQGLRGRFPAQGLARPGVQLRGDRVQVLTAMGGQVGALRKVLAQQPVGVLVAAPLQRGMGRVESSVYAGDLTGLEQMWRVGA